MSECWKCDEELDGYGNYCTQCGAPQSPDMAAQSFYRSAGDFTSGMNGLLDLLDGCPEMLAEGLGDEDISFTEWEDRFENSFKWLKSYFYTLWMSHYDLDMDELDDLYDEFVDEIDDGENDDALPEPVNEICACGGALPTNAPSIITRWKESTDSKAVCFDCFGQISTKISVSE